MDSSYFLISNNTSNNISTNDLEQSSSSSPFNYDPFDGFSFLDQQGLRLYDYFGAGGGRNSPISQYPSLDQLDNLQHKNLPFCQASPNQEDDDDLQRTLTSFVGDLGTDSDAGYTSGVDLFATNTIECSDTTEAYYFRLAMEQNINLNGSYNNNNNNNSNNYSDINNNNYNSNINNYDCNSYNSCNGDSNSSRGQTAKRSVLMNLLIDGSDVGAGYTSHNSRALPQRLIQQQHQKTQTNNTN